MGKKLITFALWGDNPKYCVGAIKNVELAQQYYPGWICRFYVSGGMRLSEVEGRPGVLVMDGEFNKTYLRLLELQAAGAPVEIIHTDEPADWTGMFWRFYPASEEGVDAFISRDCDSRLNAREAAAVNDWMNNPHLLHVMRDHPHHSVPILGGMWGAKTGAIPDMTKLIAEWNKEDRWQTDQDFLRHVIWPRNYWKAMVHDDWNRFPMPGTERRSFPTPRDQDNFVGAIIGPNEERLHPEHHAML